ncbi:MAG TPA: tetratricopeptide repeat protein [Kofleriaceae bacterium]|nr:tetratricopeptide repeat protein [Kofleriaceae bacterium]
MGLLLVLIAAACGASKAERSAEVAAKYLPATLETSRPRGGEVRTAKIRIFIDQGVQATPHAREEISDQVDYASQVLQPMLGVKLVIDSINDWTRTGDPNDALRELTASQKPDGVTWVIGYVTASDTASSVMTELGSAEVLGHHVTVRAWAEKPETQLLTAVVSGVKSADRAELFAAHRRHKQTVVLLHMLATTLGAIAEADPTWIQYVSYAPKQNMFSNRNRELLQLAVDGRLAGETDQVIASKLIDSIEKNAWGGWVPTSHDEVVAALRRVVEAGRDSKTFAGIPPAAIDEFKRISELARQGKPADALIELDNLLIAYPGNAAMHELKCEIMISAPGIADKATRAACARVVELAPGDPTVHFVIGEALIRAHDIAGARAELALAETKIANLPTGATEAWRRLIALYTGLGSLTWTEEVIAKAGLEKDPTALQAAQTRARYGIPRGAKFVTPDQEASLVAAIRGVLDLVYASKFAEAGRALAAAEKKWPGAPGLTAARCDLAFRMGQIEAAQGACARALAADPDDSWALYLYGVLLLRDGATTSAGIQKLKKAIEVDPDLAQAWRTLAKAYARGHDKAALDELGKAYTAKFGQSLPP